MSREMALKRGLVEGGTYEGSDAETSAQGSVQQSGAEDAAASSKKNNKKTKKKTCGNADADQPDEPDEAPATEEQQVLIPARPKERTPSPTRSSTLEVSEQKAGMVPLDLDDYGDDDNDVTATSTGDTTSVMALTATDSPSTPEPTGFLAPKPKAKHVGPSRIDNHPNSNCSRLPPWRHVSDDDATAEASNLKLCGFGLFEDEVQGIHAHRYEQDIIPKGTLILWGFTVIDVWRINRVLLKARDDEDVEFRVYTPGGSRAPSSAFFTFEGVRY